MSVIYNVTYMEDRRGTERIKRMKKEGPHLQCKSITEQTDYYTQLRTHQRKLKHSKH
jgi:hypothetical protein